MKELALELASRWQSYYERKHIDGSNRADIIINKDLKERLTKINEDLGFKDLIVGASSGEGNITRGPWLASFDTRNTKTATQGFYVVFLFSTDMKTLTLELGLGATQFTSFYGQNKAALQEIRRAALKLQVHALGYLHITADTSFIDKVSLDVSQLTNKTGYSLQKGYEEASILHLSYDLDASLDEKVLISDYERFINIYQLMVEDKLIPSVSELVDSSIEQEELIPKVSAAEFVSFKPRPNTGQRKHAANGAGGKGTKSSQHQSTKQIGDWGEFYIYNREINFLTSIGRSDLASQVIHEEAKNNRPGWDITTYDEEGNVKRVEVKSTTSSSMSGLTLTANELAAAEEHGDSYFLYLLTGVNAKGPKRVEVMQNPFKLINRGDIQIKPSAFDLKLFPEE